MKPAIDRVLRRQTTVYAACGVALALGLFFVFVWAPHPYGWEGFDHYHTLALEVAAGRPFPTMEYPWGYAYFLAFFYRLFGDRPWIPLVVQSALNAALPLLVYRFALTWVDRRTAVLAAVLTGVFSFNTVYASTQSSDALCTVIFMTTLVAFVGARAGDRWRLYVLAGTLAGLAAQFRPNLILVPLLLATFVVFARRRAVRPSANLPDARHRVAHAGVLLVAAAVTLTPWIVRNYRLTGTVLPTSVRGGLQLWYGTLQVGPYLHSRAYNPRAVFDAPVFDYTSLDRVPIIISAHAMSCAEAPPSNVALVYWTDHDSVRHRLPPSVDQGTFRFEIPAPGRSAVIYYYFDATWPSPEGPAFEQATPIGGEASPFIYFVSQDHLGDLDVHGD